MFAFNVQLPNIARLVDLSVGFLATVGSQSRANPASPANTTKDCIHSATNRDCWGNGFDLYTDYEKAIPTGKLVEYDLTISNAVMAPDGYLTNMTVINGQFPGPTIEADWGDTIRITVHNNLTNHNGTSFHWHGIRQFETNWLDGVPGVTQCPSKPGDTQVVEFRAMQYGTAWYHSHYSLQYTNGALGPIQINGPSSMNYDVNLGPLVISDWYHHDAFGLFHYEIASEHAPLPVTTVVNGKGVFDCDPDMDSRCTGKHERHEMVFEAGKRYKLGLLNTGSLLTYKFWIDGHNFTVIQNDFVPIKPYVTDALIVGIAQRYEIIIEANATLTHGSNFWLHATYCDDDSLLDSKIGIIRYNAEDKQDPPDHTPSPRVIDWGCADPAPTDLVPIVPRTVGKEVNGFSPADYLRIGLQYWPNVSDTHSLIHKWVLANRTQYIDWRDPSLLQLATTKDDKQTSFHPDAAPIVLDYDTGDWVYFVIANNYSLSEAHTPRTIPRSVHPIHLHGHDFVILAQGDGEFTPDVVPNLDNPARRDVVNCPIGGYVWIAFQVNNPGAWLMHCHIAWHASAGLSLQFIEQPGRIPELVGQSGALPDLKQRCRDWTEHYDSVNIPKGVLQDDSGI